MRPIFARQHDLTFRYSRSALKLEIFALDAGNGACTGKPYEAARNANAVLLAVQWSQLEDVLNLADQPGR